MRLRVSEHLADLQNAIVESNPSSPIKTQNVSIPTARHAHTNQHIETESNAQEQIDISQDSKIVMLIK